ncbi:transmembrane protein 14C-like [Hydractinia symbiolongicarpus]|uniref:transmembrane protein 14C-like n=1 Tax=Hydractinia symbiolongicarpus TaxID=13093 RepID=UPI00254CE037|nr:transmembrane protein 14C-like [Hydractinia symbiolongicarpus]
MATDFPTYIFAGLVLLGGVTGYLKRGSIPSLAAGVIFSLIFAYGATQTSKDPKNIWVVLIASIVLLLAMGSRYHKSGKFMPAGFVCLLSALNICRHLFIYKQR